MNVKHLSRPAAALAVGAIVVSGTVFAQEERMRRYERQLEEKIRSEAESFRLKQIENQPQDASRPPGTAGTTAEALDRPFQSVVNVYESNDGEGQDTEIRLTMPIDAFMEFAPIAALQAAAIPHKFPVVYIFVREETTDRVGRVAFRDAEPIAGRHLAGDGNAIQDMKDALIWH